MFSVSPSSNSELQLLLDQRESYTQGSIDLPVDYHTGFETTHKLCSIPFHITKLPLWIRVQPTCQQPGESLLQLVCTSHALQLARPTPTFWSVCINTETKCISAQSWVLASCLQPCSVSIHFTKIKVNKNVIYSNFSILICIYMGASW